MNEANATTEGHPKGFKGLYNMACIRALNPETGSTRNPQYKLLALKSPKPQTLNPKPKTLNPKP